MIEVTDGLAEVVDNTLGNVGVGSMRCMRRAETRTRRRIGSPFTGDLTLKSARKFQITLAVINRGGIVDAARLHYEVAFCAFLSNRTWRRKWVSGHFNPGGARAKCLRLSAARFLAYRRAQWHGNASELGQQSVHCQLTGGSSNVHLAVHNQGRHEFRKISVIVARRVGG